MTQLPRLGDVYDLESYNYRKESPRGQISSGSMLALELRHRQRERVMICSEF